MLRDPLDFLRDIEEKWSQLLLRAPSLSIMSARLEVAVS